VRTARVEEREVLADARLGRRDRFVGVQVHLLILHRAIQPLNKHVSRHEPRPYMLMRISWRLSTAMKSAAVNFEPWVTSPDLGTTKGSGYWFVVRWSCRSYSSGPLICYDTDKSNPSGECTQAVRMGE